MPLKELAEQSDLFFYEILRNPSLATEFIQNVDKTKYDEPFELSWYQKEFILDLSSFESIRTARATGKTVSLVSLISWYLIYNVFPEDYITFHVPNKVHLEPVWTGLVRSFRTNTFLKHFISPNAGVNSSDYKLTLLNQASMLCRIAGQSGTGASVVGLHTPIVIFDESGYYPWNVFIEAQPTLNTFTTGHKMIVAGVPDGRREKSVCYYCDQEDSRYSKHHVTALENPRFTEKDRQQAIEQYGGEESDDYLHLALGYHGKPVFSLFDRSLFEIGTYPVYKLSLNGIDLHDDLALYFSRIDSFPGIGDRNTKVIIGIDLGYTEPSAIVIMYLDQQKRLKFHGRIQLNKVAYPIQERLIDRLDSRFDPMIIGIDKGAGGQGISLIQHMTQDNEYMHKNYMKKIYPVDFSSYVELGMNSDGTEIKAKMKPHAVSVLQEYSNNHKIVYSSTDLELITELERMTYTKNPSGEIVYRTLTTRGGKKGDDHHTAALLCGVIAYYMNNEYFLYKPEHKKLFRPTWFLGN